LTLNLLKCISAVKWTRLVEKTFDTDPRGIFFDLKKFVNSFLPNHKPVIFCFNTIINHEVIVVSVSIDSQLELWMKLVNNCQWTLPIIITIAKFNILINGVEVKINAFQKISNLFIGFAWELRRLIVACEYLNCEGYPI
jgi:hypothetical protein